MSGKPSHWMLVTRREWVALIAYALALNLDGLWQESEGWRAVTNVLLVAASAWAIYTLWTAPPRPRWQRLGDDR